MNFIVKSLRLQESKWGGYYLAIDFDESTSTSVKISKKRFFELKNIIEKRFPNLVLK